VSWIAAIIAWIFGLQIYLPIAETSISVALLLGLGTGVGLLSGLFGIGGGFLLTPLLIFIGIPPAVAVGTQANQVVASSISGVLAYWSRGAVDFKMGMVLLAGGLMGSTLGVFLFALFQRIGQIDMVIAVAYVVTLGFIGVMMTVEALSALRRFRAKAPPRKLHQHHWVHGLPFKMRFKKSRLYISVALPMAVSFVIGIISAIMGVGGAFLMVPAMIYLVGMPTAIVVGTSLFQIIFVAANVTFLHAVHTQSVDALLALILTVGSVVGAQIGGRLGPRLNAEQLRLLLALFILATGGVLFYQLIARPSDLYTIVTAGGLH